MRMMKKQLFTCNCQVIQGVGKGLGVVVLAGILAACATATPQNPDPYEKYNRSMYRFNAKMDHAVLKPVAKGYTAVTPQVVRTGVTNFFENVHQVPTIMNDLLQGEFKIAGWDTLRLVMNSTLGLFGLIDVAGATGIHHHDQNFGLTLAKWTGNKPDSPYFILPLLGPSTVKGALGTPVDFVSNPISYVEPAGLSYGLTGLWAINKRAGFLGNEKVLNALTLDPYVAQRNAYLQLREQQLQNSGKSPFMPYTIWSYQYELSDEPSE
ncbi:MlaA family lipoprotein [Piscirickettsia salmonis]|nr:VacJ family lipoprotein [Piscirickettsia salmonis]AKP72471.1 vacJ like lipofamily protein [Piscirickettsia salmonis LF-89 = ATCC VR-1361]ALY03875.1 vacJ like lipofamily protein [Piscirickettsia salmonis]AMA43438.1 vacJ like lipofamily protein [Piscirickettsia salmonis]AOS35907.1 vacJ like lipofamily protein [Piscirickettsia salmonis]APS60610.1 vacJ like lipofamily protein [Piscirickettsia salmonis]